MANIQTLTLAKKKYALLPMSDYEKLMSLIEDLEDLAEVKKRKNEPRITLEKVKRNFLYKKKGRAI